MKKNLIKKFMSTILAFAVVAPNVVFAESKRVSVGSITDGFYRYELMKKSILNYGGDIVLDEYVNVLDLCRENSKLLGLYDPQTTTVTVGSSEASQTTTSTTVSEELVTSVTTATEEIMPTNSETMVTTDITEPTTVPSEVTTVTTESQTSVIEMTTTTTAPVVTEPLVTTPPLQVEGIPESILKHVKYRGIDVSRHQGDIDWLAVKDAGVDFAIIRAGYGRELSQKDPYFEEYYAEAKRAGVDVGAYWYSYADSVETVIQEAQVFLKVIEGKQFEYPLVFDIEDSSQQKLSPTLLTDMVIAFCTYIYQHGYYVSLYTNPNWITYYLQRDRLTDFDKWLANWSPVPMYGPEFGGMWQYTNKGSINGISTNVDLNFSYIDYKSLMKTLHLNGY